MSPAVRTVIVDDEPLARLHLRTLVESLEGWEIVGEASGVCSAGETIRSTRPDVVFLDVRMPGGSGLEVARALEGTEPRPLVVFATAFEDHAVEAFEVEAADYLVKPLTRSRFLAGVTRLERRLERRRRGTEGNEAASPERTEASPPPEMLALKSVGRVRLVAVEDVWWIGAAGNYVRLYLEDACYLHRTTLSSLERELPRDRFLRIHRSTMVHRARVVEIRGSAAGRTSVVLRDGTELEISQRFRPRVLAALVPES